MGAILTTIAFGACLSLCGAALNFLGLWFIFDLGGYGWGRRRRWCWGLFFYLSSIALTLFVVLFLFRNTMGI